MYNKRWFKVLAVFVVLASVAFPGSPQAAAAPLIASGSNCTAALRQGYGTVMPGQLSDREICYRLQQIQGWPTATTVNLPADSSARSPGLAAPAAGMENVPDYFFRVTTHVEGHGQ